jgi:hypothetical protein
MVRYGLVAAATALKVGELIELTGNTNTEWVPLDSDESGLDGDIAIAAEEVTTGDRLGYFRIWVPRPGDVWKYPVATASASAMGTALTYSSSEQFTTGGTNEYAYIVGDSNYPKQGHRDADAAPDAGTTLLTTTWKEIAIEQASSYYARLFV